MDAVDRHGAWSIGPLDRRTDARGLLGSQGPREDEAWRQIAAGPQASQGRQGLTELSDWTEVALAALVLRLNRRLLGPPLRLWMCAPCPVVPGTSISPPVPLALHLNGRH